MNIFRRDHPRSFSLVSGSDALVFHHSISETSVSPKCIVEFRAWDSPIKRAYKAISTSRIHGCLGLINIEEDTFLCVVTAATKSAELRVGETIYRILAADFYCLTKAQWDNLSPNQAYHDNASYTDGQDYDSTGQGQHEHPCLPLRKLLSGGTFYFSPDFDITNRMQNRALKPCLDIETVDDGFMWNTYMVSELLLFRSRLRKAERQKFDKAQFLTTAIRGFVDIKPCSLSGNSATLILMSRLSCKKAGTRFNSRGIDDEGNTANFVETETLLKRKGWCFSSAQIRGSVPVFFEQIGLQLIAKITLSRSADASQPSFDRHMEAIVDKYGAVHVVNLLGAKPGEQELTDRYHLLTSQTEESVKYSISFTDYDFNFETRGVGYEQANTIIPILQERADGFAYFLEDLEAGTVLIEQNGVFRTNCLDCLDRTNVVQGIISRLILERLLLQKGLNVSSDFWQKHSTLWADNGDSLSKIYTGTGALKSSFTRSGKTSFAGAVSDLTKNVGRAYINNFADKARQNTIDMLLGRLISQMPVRLYDPINDYVAMEMSKRMKEYTQMDKISIFVGTFNLNGKMGSESLAKWLHPNNGEAEADIYVIGFQEIVELTPSQIMSTDPAKRLLWEGLIQEVLETKGKYMLLRSGQLVGTSLMLFVKSSHIGRIRNVEGGIKNTGMRGMSGNKGAVAIRMDYANTALCFVTAHLAAGHSNVLERNEDYHTIDAGLHFQRGRKICDHESIIWLGDFNYRISRPNEEVRARIKAGDYASLYEHDQLNTEMIAGNTFSFFSESEITFPPTYKFDNHTDEYDTSEKQRIPAWTDRILRRGANLRQSMYSSASLRFSDHRPVYGIFEADVTIIDEPLRDELSQEIYKQRQKQVVESTIISDDTDSILVQLEKTIDRRKGRIISTLLANCLVPPPFPPPSSDRHKWWQEEGVGCRVRVNSPPRQRLNPNLPANPFSLKIVANVQEERLGQAASGSDSLREGAPAVRKKPTHLESTRIERQPPLPPRSSTPHLTPRAATPRNPPPRRGSRPPDGTQRLSRAKTDASQSPRPSVQDSQLAPPQLPPRGSKPSISENGNPQIMDSVDDVMGTWKPLKPM